MAQKEPPFIDGVYRVVDEPSRMGEASATPLQDEHEKEPNVWLPALAGALMAYLLPKAIEMGRDFFMGEDEDYYED